MRISDEERQELAQLMDQTHMSVSDIMREAMSLFKARLTNLEMNRQAA
jgi:hypothetical protein